MKKDISFEKINNNRLYMENNEQLLSLIQDIMKKYELEHSEIIFAYFKDKDLLKIFELNRRRYKFTREGYLSDLSLSYILVYFDKLLEKLELMHKRKSISDCFLDKYFENDDKLTYFCSDIVGDVFNVHTRLSISSIENHISVLLFNDFLTGLHKMKLYYNIFIGRVSNKYIMKFKSEVNDSKLLDFVNRISINLTDDEIMYIYNLCKRNMEELSKDQFKTMNNIIKSFNKKKSHIIVQPNYLIDEDKILIKNIPNFLKNQDSGITFKNFQDCSNVLKQEANEVYIFIAEINKNIYTCKIRKMMGALYLYIYDDQNIIYKDRIYFLEDLKRFVLIIKEQNMIKVNNNNFWN